MKEIIKILTEEHNFVNLFWFNFHKVDDGIYRSAQLTPWRLKKIIKKYKIKTIINLRGKQNYLYKKEEEICKKLGVEYINISISSRRLPDYKKLEELKKILLDDSKKPLLFHCKAGADRTGFVAVLYHILKGKSVDFAIKKELKLRYGYISFSKAGIVREFFRQYNNRGDIIKWSKDNKDKIKFKSSKFIDFIYEKILKRE